MAQRQIVELIDDVDGGPADTTVRFALDGRSYDVDLSDENADMLRAAMAPFIAAGRRAAAAGTVPAARSGEDPAAIRAWARDNGYEISARGRVSREVRQAYRNR